MPIRFSTCVLLTLCAAAPLLGGGERLATFALLAIPMGLLIAVAPPRGTAPRYLGTAALATAVGALAGFLPRWLSPTPSWRRIMDEDLEIDTGGLISVQPWVSLEGFIVLLGGLVWLCYLAGRDWPREERPLILRGLALVVLAYACVALAGGWFGLAPASWEQHHGYSPFKNRNHFSTLLAMGSVLILAVANDSFRERKLSWVIWSLALVPVLAALVANFSRAGILLAFGGAGCWILLVSLSARSTARLATGASLLLALAAIFVLFGGQTFERFSEAGVGGILEDGRVPIYQDTLNLIRSVPVAGIGLGNFEEIFATIRDAFGAQARVLHPESDWLWLGAEGGLLVLVPALAVVGVFGAAYFPVALPGGRVRQRRLRAGALCAAIVVLIHSVIDVPAHTAGVFLFASVAVAVGLPHRRRDPESEAVRPPGVWRSAAWRSAGLALAAAASLVAAARYLPSQLPGSGRASQTIAQSWEAIHANPSPSPEASAALDEALRYRPLDWEAYFLRGEARARSRTNLQGARADFRRARFLSPESGRVADAEAEIWLDVHPRYAMPAWRVAIGQWPERTEDYFRRAQRAADAHPGLADAVVSLASSDPKLLVQYVASRNTSDAFETYLVPLIESDPALRNMNPTTLRRLLDLWAKLGDRTALIEALQNRPAWQEVGWHLLAAAEAEQGNFQAAYQLADRYLPPAPSFSAEAQQPIGDLRRNFYLNPTDVAAGLRLLQAELRQGLEEDALNTVEKLQRLDAVPAYLPRLKASALAQQEAWEDAWLEIGRL
ncbi:hypothetical protein BH23VER1_BH23VER1_27680 [soil metagenome]